MVAYDVGIEEAVTFFEFFLSIFIPADIEPFVNYNYCPTCGQLIEVENE